MNYFISVYLNHQKQFNQVYDRRKIPKISEERVFQAIWNSII